MDEQKLLAFKSAALENGYNESEVNSFLEMAKAAPQKQPEPMPEPPMPMAQPLPTTNNYYFNDMQVKGLENAGVEDVKQQMSRMLTPTEQGAATSSIQRQQGMLPSKFPVTQKFGNRSSIEKYSGGVNLGTDFSVPAGTPMATPPGEWKVIKATPGWNGGSGNMVKIQNTKTGETIGYEHLSKIEVQPGQIVGDGLAVGLSGGNQGGAGRGNSTGAHASIPYQDASGRYRDILSSPYSQYVFGGS